MKAKGQQLTQVEKMMMKKKKSSDAINGPGKKTIFFDIRSYIPFG